ncbi:unnamed protein product [Meloidogyne enterolobii]|uniref:Uncharacterized protein n=1 Tax=Meloidogyne enterolobii TaxID=390850 RepID=A0ACB1APE2_MELEN
MVVVAAQKFSTFPLPFYLLILFSFIILSFLVNLAPKNHVFRTAIKFKILLLFLINSFLVNNNLLKN